MYMYTYKINTLSLRKPETNAITIPNITAKCFQHQTIPTEPQRVSCCLPEYLDQLNALT